MSLSTFSPRACLISNSLTPSKSQTKRGSSLIIKCQICDGSFVSPLFSPYSSSISPQYLKFGCFGTISINLTISLSPFLYAIYNGVVENDVSKYKSACLHLLNMCLTHSTWPFSIATYKAVFLPLVIRFTSMSGRFISSFTRGTKPFSAATIRGVL